MSEQGTKAEGTSPARSSGINPPNQAETSRRGVPAQIWLESLKTRGIGISGRRPRRGPENGTYNCRYLISAFWVLSSLSNYAKREKNERSLYYVRRNFPEFLSKESTFIFKLMENLHEKIVLPHLRVLNIVFFIIFSDVEKSMKIDLKVRNSTALGRNRAAFSVWTHVS